MMTIIDVSSCFVHTFETALQSSIFYWLCLAQYNVFGVSS